MANKKLTVSDVTKIVELIAQIHEKGHYASIDFSNHGTNVSVYFTYGKFRSNGFDFYKYFNLTAEDEDVNTYFEIVNYFSEVLEENNGTHTEL